MSEREFSIVICTDGRLTFLKNALESLRYLDYRAFEVCVVCGPTPDGARGFVEAHVPSVKVARCPARNLSQARNLGIAIAGGEIVAFIDDDAVPEAEWLADLNAAYDDPEIVAAGGVVYDGAGLSFQARFATINRLGYSCSQWAGPTPRLNYPFAPEFPHLLGANCSFRRRTLIELGGFDEEYEYFLDESDLIARVNDSGGGIAQLSRAAVHHKPAPSATRISARVVKNWRSLFKNRVYFGYRNGVGAHSRWDVLRAALDDAASWQAEVERQIAAGDLGAADLPRFEHDVESGIEAGLAAAREPRRKLMRGAPPPPPLLPFPGLRPPEDRLCLCLLSRDYPPGQNGGVARNVAEVAAAWARLGHYVHVFTAACGEPSVAFQDGVWVHRLTIDSAGPPPDLAPPHEIPRGLWDYSQTMFEAVVRLDGARRVDLVYAPLWDAEPIAFLHASRFPLVVALQTTLDFWLDSQPERRRDPEWMRARGAPLLALERWTLERAALLHANSRAIWEDISRRYAMAIPEERVVLAPHGLSDWAARGSLSPGPRVGDPDLVRILFVGRLEARKGADVLLAAAPEVLRRCPWARLDIVGDADIERAEGGTYKAAFLAAAENSDVRDRIVFHGRVEERALRRFYGDCDLLVAPSRYESFGLVYLEAMVYAKPVIGGRGGGGPEVIEEDVTGLLVDPGDIAGLAAAMLRLASHGDLRRTMGEAGRRRYEARFRSETTAAHLLEASLRRMGSVRSGGAPCRGR